MAQTALRFPFSRDTKKIKLQPSRAWARERAELEQSLSRTSAQIHQAYQAFNTTCEEELIESYIFEINALHARYNYLLRRLKEGAIC